MNIEKQQLLEYRENYTRILLFAPLKSDDENSLKWIKLSKF